MLITAFQTGHEGNRIRLAIAVLAALLPIGSPVLAQPAIVPCQTQKLLASDGASEDRFGYAVAISGDTAVVGAITDDNGSGADTGAAYIFVRSGSTWTEQAKLMASDAAAGDHFGRWVALSGDTLLIGAPGDNNTGGIDAGTAYVFVRSGSTWTQQAKLTPADGSAYMNFGSCIAIDGDTAIIGMFFDNDSAGGIAPSAAYVFVRDGETWSQQAKLSGADALPYDYFASAVAISDDTAVVGSRFDDNAGGQSAGAAYVFARRGTKWIEQVKLAAADASQFDSFGMSVAISGNIALIGAWGDDNAGGTDAGAGYVFGRSGSTWTQQAKLTASDASPQDRFGLSVALNESAAVIGVPYDDDAGEYAGSAYAFVRNGSSWTEQSKLSAADAAATAFFGASVALSGDTALFGAWGDDNAGGPTAGAAYLFALGPDCNANGSPDECDINSGISLDANHNGIPDECEPPPCPADITGDDTIDVNDLLILIGGWGVCPQPCPPCAADINRDCAVDVNDFLLLIAGWGECA